VCLIVCWLTWVLLSCVYVGLCEYVNYLFVLLYISRDVCLVTVLVSKESGKWVNDNEVNDFVILCYILRTHSKLIAHVCMNASYTHKKNLGLCTE